MYECICVRASVSKMYCYIDVKRVTDSIVYEDQSEINIEFPIHADNTIEIHPGSKRKIRSTTFVFNIPTSHYVSFNGINTNISLSTKSQLVLHPESNGLFIVDVMNFSLETRIIPQQMKLGTLNIKKYDTSTESLNDGNQQR